MATQHPLLAASDALRSAQEAWIHAEAANGNHPYTPGQLENLTLAENAVERAKDAYDAALKACGQGGCLGLTALSSLSSALTARITARVLRGRRFFPAVDRCILEWDHSSMQDVAPHE